MSQRASTLEAGQAVMSSPAAGLTRLGSRGRVERLGQFVPVAGVHLLVAEVVLQEELRLRCCDIVEDRSLVRGRAAAHSFRVPASAGDSRTLWLLPSWLKRWRKRAHSCTDWADTVAPFLGQTNRDEFGRAEVQATPPPPRACLCEVPTAELLRAAVCQAKNEVGKEILQKVGREPLARPL